MNLLFPAQYSSSNTNLKSIEETTRNSNTISDLLELSVDDEKPYVKTVSKRSLDCLPDSKSFRGNIISVSDYSNLSTFDKFVRSKQLQLGVWLGLGVNCRSKKTPVQLEIGNDFVIETRIEDNQVLSMIAVEDMKFALTSLGVGKR